MIIGKTFWAVLGLYSLAVGLILSGFFDQFSPTGVVNRGVALTILTMDILLICGLVLICLNFRKWRIRLRIIVASILIALVCAEVAVRLFHRDGARLTYKLIYSPEFHHTHPQKKEMVFESSPMSPAILGIGDRVTASTNEIGLRTHYSRERFLAFPRRIAILGDSFAFGLGVGQEEALPQVLEKNLGERLGKGRLAVLNAGAPSYSPFIERILFEKELHAWRPDIVLLVLDATDIGDDWQYQQQIRQGEKGYYFPQEGLLKLFPPGDSLADRCALCQRLFLPLTLLKGFLLHPVTMSTESLSSSPIRLEIGGKVETNRFFIYRHPLEITLPYFEGMLANITAIAHDVKASGGRFLLVVPPRFQHWSRQECPRNWEADSYSLNEPFQNEMFRFFEERRQSVGFPILNLLPAFEATSEFPLVFEDDPHWNAAGHRFVANLLEEELVALGWLDLDQKGNELNAEVAGRK